MNEIRIDKNVAAMKLIEILLAKGMIPHCFCLSAQAAIKEKQ